MALGAVGGSPRSGPSAARSDRSPRRAANSIRSWTCPVLHRESVPRGNPLVLIGSARSSKFLCHREAAVAGRFVHHDDECPAAPESARSEPCREATLGTSRGNESGRPSRPRAIHIGSRTGGSRGRGTDGTGSRRSVSGGASRPFRPGSLAATPHHGAAPRDCGAREPPTGRSGELLPWNAGTPARADSPGGVGSHPGRCPRTCPFVRRRARPSHDPSAGDPGTGFTRRHPRQLASRGGAVRHTSFGGIRSTEIAPFGFWSHGLRGGTGHGDR